MTDSLRTFFLEPQWARNASQTEKEQPPRPFFGNKLQNEARRTVLSGIVKVREFAENEQPCYN